MSIDNSTGKTKGFYERGQAIFDRIPGMPEEKNMKPNSRRSTVDKYKNIAKVKRLDFDRFDMLVSERLGALKIYAQTVGKTESDVHDAICRDLILPCVYLLAEFLEAVKIGDKEENS